MANATTFAGTGLTQTSNYEPRVLLYYWPISNLPAKPTSGSVTVTLHGAGGNNYTTSDYSLVLFDGGNQTYPQYVSNWAESNENVAYCTSSGSKYNFYLGNTNFTNNYTFYVNTPVTITMNQDGTGEIKTFNFDIPATYQDRALWNDRNIFLGFAMQNNENKYIYWRKNSTATLTLNTAVGTVKYYTGSAWVDCEVNYYNGSGWNQCEVSYYDGSNWKTIG